MTKTIEERSKDYIHENFEGWEDRGIMDMCADAYEQGAKDQLKIDVKRLRQWLEREYAYNGSLAVITPDMIDEICEAMEDKQ